MRGNISREIHRRDQPQEDRGEHGVEDEGAVVGFFSLEMSSDQLAARVLADVSAVPSDKMRRGDLSPRDYEQIREAATTAW